MQLKDANTRLILPRYFIIKVTDSQQYNEIRNLRERHQFQYFKETEELPVGGIWLADVHTFLKEVIEGGDTPLNVQLRNLVNRYGLRNVALEILRRLERECDLNVGVTWVDLNTHCSNLLEETNVVGLEYISEDYPLLKGDRSCSWRNFSLTV